MLLSEPNEVVGLVVKMKKMVILSIAITYQKAFLLYLVFFIKQFQKNSTFPSESFFGVISLCSSPKLSLAKYYLMRAK